MKSRGVYETPGGTLLHHAHRAVESITLDREVAHLRDELIPRYAEMVYNGFWFAPERRALQAFMDEVQKRVNGEARLRLYKGSVAIEGRRSEKYDLYDQATATFEQDEVYDQADAAGFIRLNALQAAPNRRGTARGGGVTAGSVPTASPPARRSNLWSGRFREPPADALWRFTVDHTDRRLLEIDVEGSIAHVAMLGKVGLLDDERAPHDHRGTLLAFSPRPAAGRSSSSRPTRMSTRQSSAGWSNWSGKSARNFTPAGHATTRWPWICGCI